MKKSLKILAALALLATPNVAAATTQLITNGGFENGLAGWTCNNSGPSSCKTAKDFDAHYSAWGYRTAQDGANAFWGWGTRGASMLSQSFETKAGWEYELSFWSRTPVVHAGNTLSYQIDAGELVSVAATRHHTQTKASFVASGVMTTLSFLYETDPRGQFWVFDEISVTAIGAQKQRAVFALETEANTRLPEIPQAPAQAQAPASIALAPVPVPAAFPLLAVGLAGLAGLRARRRARG